MTPGTGDEVRRLAVLAAVSLGLAAVPALGAADLLQTIGDRFPALALLRDAHRFLAPAALLLAVGLAGAVTWAREQVGPGREAMGALAGLLVLAPLLLLPSLAWGAGDLERSSYPDDWAEVARTIEAAPDAVTIVLPWAGSYRRFDWAAGRAVLDPAPRFLPGDVLVDDRTYVDGSEVASEDPRVREVQEALDSGSPEEVAAALRERGVRWVLVEQGQLAQQVPAGVAAYDGTSLALVDLGSRADSGAGVVTSGQWSSHSGYAPVVIVGHLCAFVLLIAGVGYILRSGSNRRHI